MSWPPKGVCVVSKAASVKTWKHISSLGERAACGRRSLSFFFLSRIYFHTKSQTFWADQKEIRWSCCPPHFNPMASGHLLAGGLRNFFFFFFSPAGISARYGREPARCTRELCPTGRKHKKKNTGIRISLRVVVVAGRLVVDQSAGALVVIVGRGGGFEVGQVSGRYANVLCPPFFCDFFFALRFLWSFQEVHAFRWLVRTRPLQGQFSFFGSGILRFFLEAGEMSCEAVLKMFVFAI